jgi:hypothetical protein
MSVVVVVVSFPFIFMVKKIKIAMLLIEYDYIATVVCMSLVCLTS